MPALAAVPPRRPAVLAQLDRQSRVRPAPERVAGGSKRRKPDPCQRKREGRPLQAHTQSETGQDVDDDDQRSEDRGWSEVNRKRGLAQTRVKISVPLVPPNPNEFESAARIGIARAVFGT